MTLLEDVLVPVASEADARASCDAIRPYASDVDRVTALHVIEKAGGAIDKAPMEKRRAEATDFLSTVETELGESIAVETEIGYGTDVVETIFDRALAIGVESVVFCPRGGSRIVRLLTGDTATGLVTDPPVPVVSLPNPEEG